MLKLSKSVEYAIFALKYMSEAGNETPISTKEISDSMGIPYELLAKIMQKLVRHNIIESRQGTQGGYYLLLPPNRLSLTSIIKAAERDIQITDCMFENATDKDCKRITDCLIREPLNTVQNKIIKVLNSTTLEELI